MSQSQLLPVPESNVLRNSFLFNQEFPVDPLTLSQVFFKEFKSSEVGHLLQNVTFGITQSDWFDNMDGRQRSEVIWSLRHLEDFLDALHRITSDSSSTVTS